MSLSFIAILLLTISTPSVFNFKEIAASPVVLRQQAKQTLQNHADLQEQVRMYVDVCMYTK